MAKVFETRMHKSVTILDDGKSFPAAKHGPGHVPQEGLEGSAVAKIAGKEFMQGKSDIDQAFSFAAQALIDTIEV